MTCHEHRVVNEATFPQLSGGETKGSVSQCEGGRLGSLRELQFDVSRPGHVTIDQIKGAEAGLH